MKQIHQPKRTPIIFFLLIFWWILFPFFVQAIDPFDELEDEKKKIEQTLSLYEAATATNEKDLSQLKSSLNQIKISLDNEDRKIVQLEKNISQRESDFKQTFNLLSAKVESYYKNLRINSPLLIFFASREASQLTKNLAYQLQLQNRDKDEIAQTTQEIITLQSDKKKVETDKNKLASLKIWYQDKANFLDGEIKKAKAYQDQLKDQIAQLTARQQEILAARSGSFTTSVGDVPPTDDFNASPAFNPGFSPAFAGFSFGAYTHRKGMSQYGAKGRAEQGQDFKTILRAYYQKEPVGKDTGGTIAVDGFGALDFEGYYLMGIAEMPASFPKEALKAQAIAARSYAWRYKNEGRSICTTEACQVFSSGKAANPPGEWRQAVEETRGQVIEDVVTYYSSTSGGYLTTMGWDTTDGQSGGDWTNRAYEAIGKSPWFYKAWYTADYYQSSGKCGRDHPWLTQEEMVDILNAYVVIQKGSQDDVDRVLPITIGSCPISGSSGNPFSLNEMRDKAAGLGGAYSTISSVATNHSTGGETSQVILQTDRGELAISGSEFKKAFNLRAPGYISIRSPLYQMEKK